MTKFVKGRLRSKCHLLRATKWGEFFLTVILVVFLFPGSQYLYADSDSPPNHINADLSINPTVIVPGNNKNYSWPGEFPERDKDKDIKIPEAVQSPEASAPSSVLKTETPEYPEKSQDIKDPGDIKPGSSITFPEQKPNTEGKNHNNNSPGFKVAAPVFRGNPQAGKKVAITIDDGPYAIWTAEYLKVLEDFQVPALFFLVGSRVEKHPEIVKKIVEKGFEIGSHSYGHGRLTLLKQNVLEEDFQKTVAALNMVGSVKYFRPPYGDYNSLVIETSEKYGLKAIGWNVDPRDWETTDENKITQNVLSNVTDGSIIILHEGRKSTLAALPKIITGLKEMGYQLVSVSELIN